MKITMSLQDVDLILRKQIALRYNIPIGEVDSKLLVNDDKVMIEDKGLFQFKYVFDFEYKEK